ASDRIEERLSVNLLPALQHGKYTVALGIDADGHHAFAQAEHCAELAQLEAKCLDDLPVDEIKQPWPLVQQRNLHSQRGKHGCIVQADDPCSYDDKVSRHLFQAVDLIRIKDALAIHGNFLAVSRTRPARDEDVAGANQLCSFVIANFDLVRPDETRIAFDHG